jgi:uncharacterized protein (TIGR02145 family)
MQFPNNKHKIFMTREKMHLILPIITGIVLLFFPYCTEITDTDNSKQPVIETDSTSITDIDGNIYRTIQIGNQIWTVENLKVTRYRNGDTIPNVTDATAWSKLTTGAYCFFGNDSSYAAVYGRLYNWYAVTDKRNIAPSGWHIPSEAEWDTLIAYLGGESIAGGKMKEAGTTKWASPNAGATNSSGFSALPGGYRYKDGRFSDMGNLGYSAGFWSSTASTELDAYPVNLYYDRLQVSQFVDYKQAGFSVRLVKD